MTPPATMPAPGGASLRVECGSRSRSAVLVVCQMPEKSGLPLRRGILSAAAVAGVANAMADAARTNAATVGTAAVVAAVKRAETERAATKRAATKRAATRRAATRRAATRRAAARRAAARRAADTRATAASHGVESRWVANTDFISGCRLVAGRPERRRFGKCARRGG